MPTTPVPDRFRDLLDGKVLGHLATIDAAGRPQVNPIWFIQRGDQLLFGVREETVKYRNMRANPAIALSVLDPANASRYLELRCTVTSIELADGLAWVNELSRKYTGADATWANPADRRHKITARIDRWTGQG